MAYRVTTAELAGKIEVPAEEKDPTPPTTEASRVAANEEHPLMRRHNRTFDFGGVEPDVREALASIAEGLELQKRNLPVPVPGTSNIPAYVLHEIPVRWDVSSPLKINDTVCRMIRSSEHGKVSKIFRRGENIESVWVEFPNRSEFPYEPRELRKVVYVN